MTVVVGYVLTEEGRARCAERPAWRRSTGSDRSTSTPTGTSHWLWDDEGGYPPRLVQGFHTKDGLALLVQRRLTRLKLSGTVIDTAIVERHYQQRAIGRLTPRSSPSSEKPWW